MSDRCAIIGASKEGGDISDINREEQNGDRPDVVIEIPSEGESEPAKKKKRSKWTVIDIVVAWLPAVAAVCGIVKWIMEIARCFSGGAYEAQFTNCTRLFSVEFLPRYYEPILFWIAGIALGIGLFYAIVRFTGWQKPENGSPFPSCSFLRC